MEENKIEHLPLFVYGSLRVGASNFKRVRPYVKSFHPGSLQGFQMHSFGEFPGIIPAPSDKPVLGDIVEIIPEMWEECITRLDTYEGNGFLFQRNRFQVDDLFGRVTCWVYIARTDVLDFQGAVVVKSNDWMDRG